MRLSIKQGLNNCLLIDDAYNANPEGSAEAMRVIGSFAPMKRIVVTPGLVELGEKEYECNKALGKIAAENADELIFVGEKRSVPLVEGAKETDFDHSHIYVAKTFRTQHFEDDKTLLCHLRCGHSKKLRPFFAPCADESAKREDKAKITEHLRT